MAGTEASGKTPGDLHADANDGRSGGKRTLGVERGGALRRAPALRSAPTCCASASTRLDDAASLRRRQARRSGRRRQHRPRGRRGGRGRASRWRSCRPGTANDFARRLGLPDEISAACRLAVRGTKLESLELGWMNDERPFVNVASAGLPAPAAERARRLEGPARAARVRGGRPERRDEREAAHLPRALRRPRGAGRRGVAGDGGGVGRVRRGRVDRGGRPHRRSRSRSWRSRRARGSAW